jgi:hypothetical protein
MSHNYRRTDDCRGPFVEVEPEEAAATIAVSLSAVDEGADNADQLR